MDMKKGSFTIEAALVMGILISLLIALMYLGIFLHDVSWVQNKGRETAFRMVLQGRTKQEEWYIGRRKAAEADKGRK